LLNAKTKSRIQFLRDGILSLAKHGDLSLSQILDVFKLLTLIYPRYTDEPASQDAVAAVGVELVRRDKLRGTTAGDQKQVKLGVAEQILGWLSHEVERLARKGNSDCYAPSDLFVLLSWSCGLDTVYLKHDPLFTLSNSWKVLIGSMETLLDMVAESAKAKPALKKGALVRTRRTLRSAGDKILDLIGTLLTISKTNQTPLRMVSLLDVAISVLIRLKNVSDESSHWIPQNLKDGILGLYSSTIIITKGPLPEHALVSSKFMIRCFNNQLVLQELPARLHIHVCHSW
jgi:hypothetical protein